MKIALIGYGKMGKTIENQALSRGHEVILKISRNNYQDLTVENLRKADVLIEFSAPDIAFQNLKICALSGIPIVCGTTAWLDRLESVKELVKENDGAFIYASNFSLGVNLFFALNEKLAQLMGHYDEYKPEITEIHHKAKLDAPSGTAITLANQIMNRKESVKNWVNHPTDNKTELAIISERIDPAPGTHVVSYYSTIDTIEIKHEAHNREGFAKGAVIASEWLIGKKGIFTMADVLGID